MPYKDPEAQKAKQHESYLKHQEEVKLRSRQRKLEARILLQEIKESKPCMDCKKFWPYYVMQFDHREGSDKKFDISKWAITSLNKEALMNEIAKCDLVCANCHAIRTYLRAQ